ncbi:unnamed protein product [Vitrella brassicaformis CCMP3155]|uniref:Uncharacterized protein n=1 Tax=Vitrella brassicaformis (strain CCMP3155) TaxID=1169540 RepID=A0A0G4H0X4_VITBC|nr:unnamed protein product [Vitrella brassicaformis CCMP3155]|eukprot:CEM36998.1 unnamed protein product [Vitrella brassicaformis CCMP3155]
MMSSAKEQGLPFSSRQTPGIAEDPSAPDPASARGPAEAWESFLNPPGRRTRQDWSNPDDDDEGDGNGEGEDGEGGDTPSRLPSRPPPEYSPGGPSVVGSPQPHERGREGDSRRGGMLNHAGLGGVESLEAPEASRVSPSLAPLPTSPPPTYTAGMASRQGANHTPINRDIVTDTRQPPAPAPAAAAAAAIPPRPTPSGQPQLQPPQLDEHVRERERWRGRDVRVNGEGHATGLDMGAGMQHPLTRDSVRDRMLQLGGDGDGDGVRQPMDVEEQREQGRGGEGAGRDVDMRPRNNASMREPMHKPSPLFRRGDPQPHPAAAAPSEASRDDHSPSRPPTTHPADRTSSPWGKSRDSSDLGIGRLDRGNEGNGNGNGARSLSCSPSLAPLPTSPPPTYTPGMASRQGANHTPINRDIVTDTTQPQPPAPAAAAAAAIPPRSAPSGQPRLQRSPSSEEDPAAVDTLTPLLKQRKLSKDKGLRRRGSGEGDGYGCDRYRARSRSRERNRDYRRRYDDDECDRRRRYDEDDRDYRRDRDDRDGNRRGGRDYDRYRARSRSGERDRDYPRRYDDDEYDRRRRRYDGDDRDYRRDRDDREEEDKSPSPKTPMFGHLMAAAAEMEEEMDMAPAPQPLPPPAIPEQQEQ